MDHTILCSEPVAVHSRVAASTPPPFTLVVRPKPRSGSAEADPAYQAGSSRGFCHHMADPGPAASPGVTSAWIRVMILSIWLSMLPVYPQHDYTDVVSANS
ncbi:hypothetical protein Q8A73_003196 [Channa argus]|nr:hypothetical protein Q8A73_003196 [Channa argus]